MSTNTSDWSSARTQATRDILDWLQRLRALGASPTLWTAAALGVLTIVSRLPFVTTVPYAWDSVLYLRAMRDFDVAIAQPHPPGYIFYVMTAKLLAHWVGGAHAGLVAESVIAAGAAVALTYLLGVRLVGRIGGLIGALLLAVSPPFWVYSGVAYPYTVLAAGSLLLALACSSRRLMRRWPIVAGLCLGAVGGYRTELTLFLTPLLVAVAGWFCRWRTRRAFVALGMIAAGGLIGLALWVLPTVAQSGGVVRYVAILTAQSDYVEDSYSVFSHGWAAVSSNSGQVTRFLVDSLGAAWLFAALWIASPLLPWGRSPGRRARVLFVLCWITPLIVFHSLIHIGDRGYTFAYLPALCIAAGGGAAWAVRVAHRAYRAGRGGLLPTRPIAWLRSLIPSHRLPTVALAPLVVVWTALIDALPRFASHAERSWGGRAAGAAAKSRTDAHFPADHAEPGETPTTSGRRRLASERATTCYAGRSDATRALKPDWPAASMQQRGWPPGPVRRAVNARCLAALQATPQSKLLPNVTVLGPRWKGLVHALAGPRFHAIVLGGLLVAGSASSFLFSVGRMTATDIRCFSPALQTAAAKIRAYLPADRTIVFSSFYLHQAQEMLPGYRRWFFDPVGSPRYTWQVPEGVEYIAVFGDDLPVDRQQNSFAISLPCDRRLYYFTVQPGQELRYIPGQSRVYLRRAVDPLALHGGD